MPFWDFVTIELPLLPKLTVWIQPKIRQRKVRSSRTQHGNTGVVLKASPRAPASLLLMLLPGHSSTALRESFASQKLLLWFGLQVAVAK